MLWVSDAKALQYVFQTSGYNYPKQPERRVLSRLIGDTGLTWAEGARRARGVGWGGRWAHAWIRSLRRLRAQAATQGHASGFRVPGIEGAAPGIQTLRRTSTSVSLLCLLAWDWFSQRSCRSH